MSVELGIGPASLLELEGRMFDALEQAAGRRWTIAEELAAQALELAHVHYVSFLASCGVKGHRLPSALRVPRPGPDGDFPKPAVLSPTAFAGEFRQDVIGRPLPKGESDHLADGRKAGSGPYTQAGEPLKGDRGR